MALQCAAAFLSGLLLLLTPCVFPELSCPAAVAATLAVSAVAVAVAAAAFAAAVAKMNDYVAVLQPSYQEFSCC